MNAKAKAMGAEHALEFIRENDRATIERCLVPGQEDPDHALINGLGLRITARLFGIEDVDSEDFAEACRQYNKAFLAELRAEVKQ